MKRINLNCFVRQMTLGKWMTLSTVCTGLVLFSSNVPAPRWFLGSVSYCTLEILLLGRLRKASYLQECGSEVPSNMQPVVSIKDSLSGLKAAGEEQVGICVSELLHLMGAKGNLNSILCWLLLKPNSQQSNFQLQWLLGIHFHDMGSDRENLYSTSSVSLLFCKTPLFLSPTSVFSGYFQYPLHVFG